MVARRTKPNGGEDCGGGDGSGFSGVDVIGVVVQ